ncbi:hypothetical protein CesoFtcFv8_009585 [Champsocephalus esox]|uniref:Uncharacterized protein n=1 Tax=Champsocephalus esox TaxID=159716 RepID=A0AAN8H2L7_9TELE|nr:hypothetical protein CesoFtcFv8_009585 [Champsocephalus esox]
MSKQAISDFHEIHRGKAPLCGRSKSPKTRTQQPHPASLPDMSKQAISDFHEKHRGKAPLCGRSKTPKTRTKELQDLSPTCVAYLQNLAHLGSPGPRT